MTPSPLLYKPTGAALEYCPSGTLALNPYEGQCPHSCGYCYANAMNKRFGRDYPMRPKANLLERLDAEAAKREKSGFPGRVHLSFTGDVYAEGFESTTRQVLEILKAHGLPWQVLTKRPSAALADLDLYSERCWLGATITGQEGEGGDSTSERLYALESADGCLVSTWLSVEPLSRWSLKDLASWLTWPCFVAVGIESTGTCWGTFAARDVRGALIHETEQGGKFGWYLKQSLRKLLPEGPYEGNLLSCGWRLK